MDRETAEDIAFNLVRKMKGLEVDELSYGRIPMNGAKASFGVEHNLRLFNANVLSGYYCEYVDKEKYNNEKISWKEETMRDMKDTPISVITKYIGQDLIDLTILNNYDFFEEITDVLSSYYGWEKDSFNYCKHIPDKPRNLTNFVFLESLHTGAMPDAKCFKVQIKLQHVIDKKNISTRTLGMYFRKFDKNDLVIYSVLDDNGRTDIEKYVGHKVGWVKKELEPKEEEQEQLQ